MPSTQLLQSRGLRTSTTQLIVSMRHIADIRQPILGFGRVLLAEGEHKRRLFKKMTAVTDAAEGHTASRSLQPVNPAT